MRHINTRQVDNHLWIIEVTDGYHTEWTAKLDGSFLEIRQGTGERVKIDGIAVINSRSESEAIGIAFSMVTNWAQISHIFNEKLDPRWSVKNESLVHYN